MSGIEIAALIVALFSAALIGALIVVLTNVVRSLMAMQSAVDDLNRRTIPLITDLRNTVEETDRELVRVEGLLGQAEAVSEQVHEASRLAKRAFSNPLIRVMAVGHCTKKAAQSLRSHHHTSQRQRRRHAIRRSLRLGLPKESVAND